MTYRDYLRSAVEVLLADVDALGSRWRPHAPGALIDAIVEAARALVLALLARMPPAAFGQLDPDARGTIHDVYLHVLALAGMLATASEEVWAEGIDLSIAYESTLDVLDGLSPFVSDDDRVLRSVTIDGLDVPAACASERGVA